MPGVKSWGCVLSGVNGPAEPGLVGTGRAREQAVARGVGAVARTSGTYTIKLYKTGPGQLQGLFPGENLPRI